jgi:uncharacterized repeat protein (TIGR03803 family)
MRTLTFWKMAWLVGVFGMVTAIGVSAQTLTTLLNFDGLNGSAPEWTLVRGLDGSFFGTTAAGGANGYGTIFKIDRLGKLTTLHSFDDTDGSYPMGSFRLVTGASTGQPSAAALMATVRSLRSPRVAHSRRCTISTASTEPIQTS